MSIFVIGGTGFIGQRVIRRLAARGEEVVVMDINPTAADFSDLGHQVRVIRGDVTEFSTIHFFLLNGDIELDRNWQLLV